MRIVHQGEPQVYEPYAPRGRTTWRDPLAMRASSFAQAHQKRGPGKPPRFAPSWLARVGQVPAQPLDAYAAAGRRKAMSGLQLERAAPGAVAASSPGPVGGAAPVTAGRRRQAGPLYSDFLEELLSSELAASRSGTRSCGCAWPSSYSRSRSIASTSSSNLAPKILALRDARLHTAREARPLLRAQERRGSDIDALVAEMWCVTVGRCRCHQ
ncbi:MAG: hypothetical protein JWO56_2833 [Acidobacteria bacterium]|nr:hypothetical protein [Acidobacteriota bacterium]